MSELPMLVFILSVSVASGALLFSVNPRYLPGLLGLLLPIWSLPGAPSLAFDLARWAIIFTLVARLPVVREGKSNFLWFASLLAVGVLTAATGIIDGGSAQITLGLTMTVAVAASYLMMSRLTGRDVIRFFKGYLIGASLSAAVIVIAFLGGPNWSAQQTESTMRISGLSASAPLVGFELAIAFGLALSGWLDKWASKSGLPVMVLMVVAALTSGGRSAVPAVLAVLAVALLRGRLKGWALVAIVMVGGIGFSYLSTRDRSFNTLERFRTETSGGDISSGRLDLVYKALASVKAHPVSGEGLGEFVERYGLTPHLAPLTFGVAAGLVGLLVSVAFFVKFVVTPLRRDSWKRSEVTFGTVAPVLVAPVLVTSMLVEPYGPLVGTSGLLFVCLLVQVGAPAKQGAGQILTEEKR